MAFTMEIADKKVIEEEIAAELQPEKEEQTAIKETADNNAAELFKINLDSLAERKEVVDSIEGFGMDVVEKSRKKNELLQVRVGDLSKMGSENGQVVSGLTELQQKMKELDPSIIEFGKGGILGKLINPVRNYFAKYQKADAVIDDIMKSLEKGKNILKRDNTTLESEQVSMRVLTKKLNSNIELGLQMDESMSAAIAQAKVEGIDEERIKFVEEEIQYPLRQRIMDFQQLLAVNQQGIVAMEILIRNNKELIRAVERAQNVTISALRVAVTVASALYNQKIVLEKVEALNKTTSSMISSTARMLKEQGAQIHQQSSSANISIEDLKAAFTDTFEAFDQISTFKQEALPQMRIAIDELKELTTDGEKKLRQLEKAPNI